MGKTVKSFCTVKNMKQTTSIEAYSHLVLAAYGAWGHTRPLCALAANLVKARPVYVTLFITQSFYDRVNNEISRNFDQHEVDARDRLRLVALAAESGGSFLDIEAVNSGFEHAYQQLVQELPVICAKTLKQHAAIRSPDAAVFDIFADGMLSTIRTHSQKPVKVYSWVACSASAYHSSFGITSPNKDGDIRSVIMEEASRSGKSVGEVAAQLFFSVKGEIIRIPGMPPMYDHEEYPQDMLMDKPVIGVFRMSAAELTDRCDGMIIATPHCFETPESLDALYQYYKGNVHVVGPVLPTATNAHATEKMQSDKSQEIEDFMTNILQSHGPKSLIYVSFGSVWWSTEPEKIWAFVDVLLERKVPFIFSHASPGAEVPQDVREKVHSSGLGVFSPWSPQQYILAHPVTGWFVTHCGFNGIIESVAAGVPMICWPYQADQPVNAIHLTDNLNIAYELLEVRTGLGLKPVYRTNKVPTGTVDAIHKETNYILDQAFGEDGKKKRANVEKLQESFIHAWSEQGASRMALERFLDSLHSP